ncbi:Quinate permease [Drechslerella dactyloides]|uniref:Quinate permease n=1 Tax=Drechslerella dactyloides TaxID=74499 RepID=A0AAD6IZR5_DREDA|nr:Quinate permease [Drechslerella dactyloides]
MGFQLKMPPPYIWYALFMSQAGLLFGFDTGSIGPITVMEQFQKDFGQLSPTLHGVIISMILLTAAIASVFAGHLADKISRTHTTCLGAGIFAVGSLLQAIAGFGNSSQSGKLAVLLIGRSIAGLGEGFFLTSTQVYIIEIAPGHVRGRVTSILFMGITCGLCLGYFLCYGTSRIESTMAWRIPFIWQAVVAANLSFGSLFMPHSHRWLLHVNRRDEAMAILEKMGMGTAAEREKQELLAIRENITTQETPRGRGFRANIAYAFRSLKLLAKKQNRWRASLAIFMMTCQQTTGIDGVLYYAPVLFSQAGLSSQSASFLASGVTAILMVICTAISLAYSDRWGRRPTLLYTGFGIVLSMFLIGGLYASPSAGATGAKWTIVAAIYLFVITFTIGWSMILRIYAVEIQPMETRATVNSLSHSANWVANYVIALTTPVFLARSACGPYFFFGGCTAFALLVYIFYMPETQGIGSLENMDKVFEITPLKRLGTNLKERMNRRAGNNTVSMLPSEFEMQA